MEEPVRTDRIGCDRCDEVEAGWRIGHPRDLVRAIAACRSAVERRTLREVATDSITSSPFNELKVEGPWPDIVDCTFECVHCGARFELRAETYHGSGGSWSRVTE